MLPLEDRAIKLEVCVDSFDSAVAAREGGADRLEICANLALGGGTTPSIGLARFLRHVFPKGEMELMAMIRPRTGDFCYSTPEVSAMLEDIQEFGKIGIDGVVFGFLEGDGSINDNLTRIFTREAGRRGMQVCFHRAFDMVYDQQEALSTLQSVPGMTRILTSGGKPKALEGLPALISLCSSLQSQSQMKIEIMPGSGINADTVVPILRCLLPLGCRAVHMSGGVFKDSGMLHRPEGMGMGIGGAGEWGVWHTSVHAVRAVRESIDREWEAYVKTLS